MRSPEIQLLLSLAKNKILKKENKTKTKLNRQKTTPNPELPVLEVTQVAAAAGRDLPWLQVHNGHENTASISMNLHRIIQNYSP